MKPIQHIFVSNSERMLEGWLQAFPLASSFSFERTSLVVPDAGMVWLRLSTDATVAQQIAKARTYFSTQALVVMSDMPNDLEALAVFSASARGYCNTHAGVEVLGKIAGVVSQGGMWIGESIMQRLLSAPVSEMVLDALSTKPWVGKLTERELGVAKAIALGCSNKEIALQMAITERTVKAHVGAIFEKLQVRDRLQLALLVKDS
ncbi:response regulator transcription factor [Undibacterium sp. Ren11W]|uniref:response regulator transcription factor n=1 Tax=Undibacterium sp. Ren11W TaxID=3413045 RepID=UPI003BF372D9